MGISFEAVVDIVNRRRRADSMLKQAMIDVRDRTNGEVVQPLPDVVGEPTFPITMPYLIAEAIDGPALRASSTTAQIICPAVDGSKMRGRNSREYADVRRRLLGATWFASQHGNVLRRAYRHLAGYATTSMMVVPDFDRQMPRIVIRDPLTTYGEPRAPEETRPPRNVAFVYGRSPDWIHATFPQMSELLMKAPPGIELWDLVEWVDEDEIVWGILGPRRSNERTFGTDKVLALSLNRELGRIPNRLGYVPGVIPHRVTLDKVVSQIANQVGNIDLMGRMHALLVAGAEKATYPDAYIVAKDNGTAEIVGGRWKDGREGDVNILTGVDSIGMLKADPSQFTQQAIDRMERNFRISTGLVPTQGGETYGSLRTGQGIDSMQAAAVDPRTRELQEIMEYAMAELNVAIFDTYTTYWPGRKYQLLSGWAGTKGVVEFTPDKHIETTLNMVAYALPGTDITGTTVGLAQMVGAELISKKTGRMKHPWVDDPYGEGDMINEEKLEEALRVSVLQAATAPPEQGGMDAVALARILKTVRSQGDLADAVIDEHRKTQEAQASQAPPAGPGQGAAPEQMPGLGAPQNAAQPPPSIGPPQAGQVDLKQLLSAVTASGTPRG